MPSAPPQPEPAVRSLSKKLCFSLLGIFLSLGAVEAVSRLLVDPQAASIHSEHENLITVVGLPALNATMEADADLFWRLRDGLKDQPVEGEINGAAISFRVSTRNGLRSPPPRPSASALRILALGDSCTFGVGVDDDETWPAQLEAQLGEAGIDAEVINAGVPGYSSYQGLTWFEKRGLSLDPDVVVIAFGFNDRDLWSSQSDLEIARRLPLSRLSEFASRSRFYVGLERAITQWRRSRSEDQATGTEVGASEDGRLPRLDPEQFLSVMTSIAEQAQAAGAEVVFVAWPYRAQIEKEIRQAILYQLLVEEAGRRTGSQVLHLAAPFIDTGLGPEALFVDHVHATAWGNRVASEALMRAVLPH